MNFNQILSNYQQHKRQNVTRINSTDYNPRAQRLQMMMRDSSYTSDQILNNYIKYRNPYETRKQRDVTAKIRRRSGASIKRDVIKPLITGYDSSLFSASNIALCKIKNGSDQFKIYELPIVFHKCESEKVYVTDPLPYTKDAVIDRDIMMLKLYSHDRTVFEILDCDPSNLYNNDYSEYYMGFDYVKSDQGIHLYIEFDMFSKYIGQRMKLIYAVSKPDVTAILQESSNSSWDPSEKLESYGTSNCEPCGFMQYMLNEFHAHLTVCSICRSKEDCWCNELGEGEEVPW